MIEYLPLTAIVWAGLRYIPSLSGRWGYGRHNNARAIYVGDERIMIVGLILDNQCADTLQDVLTCAIIDLWPWDGPPSLVRDCRCQWLAKHNIQLEMVYVKKKTLQLTKSVRVQEGLLKGESINSAVGTRCRPTGQPIMCWYYVNFGHNVTNSLTNNYSWMINRMLSLNMTGVFATLSMNIAKLPWATFLHSQDPGRQFSILI